MAPVLIHRAGRFVVVLMLWLGRACGGLPAASTTMQATRGKGQAADT